MGCNQCGMCCKVIVFQHSLTYMIKNALARPTKDKIFLISNWKPISLAEAEKMNPFLIKTLKENKLEKAFYYYTCKKVVDNKCSVHDNKPAICRDYPYYGKDSIDAENTIFYSETCGYKKVLTRKDEADKV